MTILRRNDGYTMIELVMVLTVVAIVVSSAAPSMQRYLERHRTERALDQIAADLAFTRLLAVRQGRPATLQFAGGGYSVLVSQADGSQATVKTVPLLVDLPGVTLHADDDVAFTSRGLVQGAASPYIRVFNADFRDSVFVSPVGRIYRDY